MTASTSVEEYRTSVVSASRCASTYPTADDRGYLAGSARHSRELLVGVRAETAETLADRGRRAALLSQAFGDGPAVRSPLSLVPTPAARPRSFGCV